MSASTNHQIDSSLPERSVAQLSTNSAAHVRYDSAATTTGSTGNVSAQTSSVELASSNISRRALIIFNDSGATLYYQFGATASTTSCVDKIDPGNTLYLMPCQYTGIVSGIWDSATGAARITEL